MIQFFYVVTANLFFFIVLNFFLKKFSESSNFFLDLDFNKPQSFHRKPIPCFGGVMILFALILNLIFFFNLNDLTKIFLILGLLNFLVGLADDLKIINKPILRFLIIILLNLIIINIYNLKIFNFEIFILDYLNQFFIFSLILTIMAIFFIVNGSNLIDGFNGLLVVHAIIIISTMYILIYKNINFDDDTKNYFYILILILIVFLLFNFPYAKVFLGDSGAYLIGSQIAILTIKLAENLNNISPLFFAILLHYLFFEILFSVFRKVLENKNPFYPDNKHLHMLIYKFLSQRGISEKIANPLTASLINSYFLIAVFFAFFLKENSMSCLIYFIFLFFLYISIYLFLRKKINQ